MLLAAPLVAVMGVVLLAILWRTCRESEAAAGADPKARAEFLGYLRDQRDQLGALSTGERNTLLVFTVAVALWVLPGAAGLPIFDGSPLAAARPWLAERLPESAVAILAAVLLFLLPLDRRQGRGTLTWREAEQIDWGTILLFGGGMALGTLMFETGVAEALGKSVVESLGVNSLWALTAASIALAIALSETASNTASANMIIPVAVAIAQSADVSPLPPALGACLGSSFGFMMPVSTPPNAIVYSSGLVPLRTMMRAGIWFDVAGFVIIWVGLRLLCPLLGYM
jgi:sodium-dependent dicarboxylate transporter 2/3/5